MNSQIFFDYFMGGKKRLDEFVERKYENQPFIQLSDNCREYYDCFKIFFGVSGIHDDVLIVHNRIDGTIEIETKITRMVLHREYIGSNAVFPRLRSKIYQDEILVINIPKYMKTFERHNYRLDCVCNRKNTSCTII